MTPERDKDPFVTDLERILASTTEYTGMLPAIATEDEPNTLAAQTDVPCPVIAGEEDPLRSPRRNGNAHPCDAHNPPTTIPAAHPAKAPAPYHRGSAHNP